MDPTSILARAVEEACARRPTEPVFCGGRRAWTWADLRSRSGAIQREIASLGETRLAALYLPQTFDAVAALVAFERAGVPVLLVSTLYPRALVDRCAERCGADRVVTFEGERLGHEAPPRRDGPAGGLPGGTVLLTTSGTTGEPKIIRHTWRSLVGAVKTRDEYRRKRWLLAYPLSHFASLQVLLQGLLSDGTLVVPEGLEPRAAFRALVDERVDCLSCTPTFVRQLLLHGGPDDWQRCSLGHVTLGGEAADQRTLDAVRAALPGVKLRHIYASTELGAVVSVSDGLEGLPASFVDGERAKIEDGQLYVRRSRERSMVAYVGGGPPPDEWFPTGDRVELTGDRVRFRGRLEDVINVGGFKVDPADVEPIIRAVEGVADAMVIAHPSSLAGNLVKAVVVAPGAEQGALRKAILEACRSRLPSHMMPRMIEFRDSLPSGVVPKRVRAPRAD